MESIVQRKLQLAAIEAQLGFVLPNTYRQFVLDKGSEVIDGFRVLGVPIDSVPLSVLEGTRILRHKRPDLSVLYVTICIQNSKALCLNLAGSNLDDPPLVEIELGSNERPIPLGKTFGQWLHEHETIADRFKIAWNRVRALRTKQDSDWETVINRVKDYVIGVAAFKYNPAEGCLEVDEFYPIDQPHIKGGESLRLLLNEMFCRARDYSGSLRVIFTRDRRENAFGKVEDLSKDVPSWTFRVPRPVPEELTAFVRQHDVQLSSAQKGIITHEEGVKLWFELLGLSTEVQQKIEGLEAAGYLTKEVIAEVVTTGIWSKEELSWILSNVSRPEALLLGADLPEDRPYYADSFSWGRTVVMATRFQQSIVAGLTEGLSVEDIEKSGIRCSLTPSHEFWLLTCNQRFPIPPSWQLVQSEQWVEADESIMFLCRPTFPTRPDLDTLWINQKVEHVLRSGLNRRIRCLLLSYEFTTPDYSADVTGMKEVVKEAADRGVAILFAPSRMTLYLDEEIRKKMRRARNLKMFPQRRGPLNLQLFQVPAQYWNIAENSQERRTIENAATSARVFAEQLVSRRDIGHYRMEFSLMCETMEREAVQQHGLVGELDGEESIELLNLLHVEDGSYKGITFPFVGPDELPALREKVKTEKLAKILSRVNGGLVVAVKPWQVTPVPLTRYKERSERVHLPEAITAEIDREKERRIKNGIYIGGRKEIVRAHAQLRQALWQGIPFSMASCRSRVFVQVIKDYVYFSSEVPRVNLPIAYNDGCEGVPFRLFALPQIKRPEGKFLDHKVGLVSLRHMAVDRLTERAVIRNAEIQRKETSAEQEDLAYRRTMEYVNEFYGFLRHELTLRELSIGFRAMLLWNPNLQPDEWDGLRLHIFLATGLEPAGVGAYRAIVELFEKYRNHLIVVPHLLKPRPQSGSEGNEGSELHEEFREADYPSAEEWY